MIYLDNNATTLLSASVAERMRELMSMRLANASSQHAAGRQARQVVETARESILRNCGAVVRGMSSDQLVFTSGGTESNNLAVFGLSEGRAGAIVVSSIEHPSVLSAAEAARIQGRTVIQLPCESDGVVFLKRLSELLAEHRNGKPIAMVSLMLANNETGVIQPVAEAAAMCRAAGVLIHTDAVQVLGKAELSFSQLGVDAMTITAHKLHGPVGIGGLILRNGVTLVPQSFGGFQQLGLRPGTEMPVLSGGFERAVEEAATNLSPRAFSMQQMRNRLEQSILDSFPAACVIGKDSLRLPHTLSVSFPGADRQALQLGLDMAGIACGTGSACASGSSQPSHVLEAMQLDSQIVKGAIRFSLSFETTASDVDSALTALKEILPRLCRSEVPMLQRNR